MRRPILLALLTALIALLSATSTQAFVAKWYDDKIDSFSGDGCGSVSTVTKYLPLKAFRISARRPQPGVVFRDYYSGEPVARLTGVKVSRETGRPAVIFTAAGSDAACAPGQPDEFGAAPDRSWLTGAIRFRVFYSTRERVFVSDSGETPRYKPRIIVFGASQRIDNLRWSRWGGKVARGRGTFPYNNCVPYCAAGHITRYRIRVVLSRRRLCNRRYQYLRIGWRFVGRVPPHSRRTQHTSMSWVCD